MSDYPTSNSSSSTFSIIAIVLGGLALLFLPIFLGPAAIVLAVIAKSKQEKLAPVALAVSILGTVIGVILGVIVGIAAFA
jgi:uncharacterized membrane protein